MTLTGGISPKIQGWLQDQCKVPVTKNYMKSEMNGIGALLEAKLAEWESIGLPCPWGGALVAIAIQGLKGKGKGKGKGPFYLTSVVPSVLQLRETAINGSRRCALYPPCHCQCSVLRVFKAIATQIRGKSKQTLKSLKIEPGTSRSGSRALANWATTAPYYVMLCYVMCDALQVKCINDRDVFDACEISDA